MKKFYSISLLFLLCFMLQAKAQTANSGLRFIDANGKVIEDGATIKSNNAIDNPFGEGGKLITEHLVLDNSQKKDFTVYVKYTINNIEGTNLGVCFGEECTLENEAGTYKIDNMPILANDENKSELKVEFAFKTKGKASVTIQVFYQSIFSSEEDPFTAGPKVTYEFTSETTGINATKAANVAYYNVFNLQGIQVLNKAASLSGLQAGTYIVQAYDNKGLVNTTKQIIR